MDERLTVVACPLDDENMSTLCREFGVAGPTGYTIFERYREL